MALTTELLSGNWRRFKEGGHRAETMHCPTQGGIELFGGAYVVVRTTTGLAERAISPAVSTDTTLAPGGVLTPLPSFGGDPDNVTHHLDTRGLNDGTWDDDLDLATNLCEFWCDGRFFFHNYQGSATPATGARAFLITEQTVRPEPTTSGLYIGHYSRPFTWRGADGWIVDISQPGIA